MGDDSPTKPITPLTATATPTMSEVTTNRFRRRRCTSTQEKAARSHPQGIERAAWAQEVDDGDDHGDGRDRSWGQLALPKEEQPEQDGLCGLGVPRKMKKLVTDSKSAESTTPHKMS